LHSGLLLCISFCPEGYLSSQKAKLISHHSTAEQFCQTAKYGSKKAPLASCRRKSPAATAEGTITKKTSSQGPREMLSKTKQILFSAANSKKALLLGRNFVSWQDD